jgi:tetratricopeptide (TPR) repeat protein
MAATFGVGTGARRHRAATRRCAAFWLASLLAILTLAPLAEAASRNDGDTGLMSDEAIRDAMKDATARAQRIQSRLRAEQRLRGEEDEYARADEAQVSSAMGFGSMLSGRSGLFGTAMLAAAFYFLFMRGRGGGGGSAGWGSYYLFWIVAPALLAVVSSHPAFLVVIVVGLVARRWLPDPILFFKHQARVRSLQTDIDANAANATARRDLAKIWLEKHRPRRALPLLEQAIARDSQSIELLYLSGVAHLLAGNHDKAVEALVAVTHREPNFQYGEAYLRAADALMALGRWDDAADALERYVKINRSSVEARYKRLRVCKARKDAAGERQAKADLRDAWRTLPGYQRRKQLGWYLRSWL